MTAPDATSPASQVGDDLGSFSQAKIPTAPGPRVRSRLGKEQLRLLRATGTNMFLIVADKRTRRLCDLGLMAEARPDSFVFVTANGLRAIADAADRGLIELGKLKEKESAA